MAMSKFRSPTDEERNILKRNGFDPDRVSVAIVRREEDSIHLKVHRTGDEIMIWQGCRRWDSYAAPVSQTIGR